MSHDLKTKRIGVLMGGLSQEREVSLRSGKAVAQALRARGYTITEIDVDRRITEALIYEKIQVAFLALHGRYGEDGTIQGILEILQIPYTGSGVLASAVGMDKEITKRLIRSLGIRTPEWKLTHRGEVISCPFSLPVIVKPNREGSTIGTVIVREEKDFQPALREAAQFDEAILIEEFISGIEVTVAVINGRSLPVIEIVPKCGFYDYASKYTKGMTEYIVPAGISESVRDRLSDISELLFKELHLAGFTRMDYIIDPARGEYFLEVNTIPGMTETSLVPKAAAAAGISFEDLCEEILRGASLKI
jgi:D-alanine-D-alanine ligase